MKPRILILSCCVISLIFTVSGFAQETGDFTLSSDSVKISYDVQGNGDPVLVLVHGWGNNKGIWDAQVAQFSKKYKVVTIDLPGFGKSGNNRQNWTISAFGKDVESVVRKLELKQVVLVGFSMGAPVAIEAAKNMPVQAVGIVLVDQLQNIEFKAPPEMIDQMDSMFFGIINAPTLENTQMFFKNNREELLKRVVAMLDSAPRVGWRESLHETFRWMNDDAMESLKIIKAPVISINSDHPPTNVEAFQLVVPSYRAKIIPDVGHVVMWDAPKEFNRLLEESIKEFVINRK